MARANSRHLSSPSRRFPVSSALAAGGRSSVDASSYCVNALGFKGCLYITVCTCTAAVLLQIDVAAIFQAAAAESTKQATARWSFQLASDTLQGVLYNQVSRAGVQGALLALRQR